MTAICFVMMVLAQTHEIGFTLGRLPAQDRTGLTLSGGTAWQANYGYRVAGNSKAALFAEGHFLANPQRVVTSVDARATRDVASLYVTPGARVKFFPAGRLQPYGVIGGGYALYEHSTLDAGGRPNAAPRTSGGGTFVYGGGMDVPVARWLAARFEVRDFYSGNPRYNVPQRSGRQHNPVWGGGFVLLLK